MPPLVTCEIADAVAFVRLDRPEKMNALTLQTVSELIATARRLRADRSVRAVVLSGNGDAFCAGLDFATVFKSPGAIAMGFVPIPWRGTNAFQEACWAWRRIPAPVIAVVHGHCLGGGLQLALGADFRISTPDAKWSVLEAKWGLVPDMSGIRSLSQLVGIDVAKRLTMTGVSITGTEAHALGLVTAVAADPHLAAGELVEQITLRSPDAVAATKRLFEDTWGRGERHTFARERWEQARLLIAGNTKVARTANARKETPQFAPRSR